VNLAPRWATDEPFGADETAERTGTA